MENTNTVGTITKQALKQKFLLFLFFLLLLISATIAGEFISNFSPFIGFVFYTCVILTISLSDIFYSFYFKKISLLSPEDATKETRWAPLMIMLSMFSIFVVGGFLNIALINYQTQANQIVLLFSLVYVFKEFWLMFISTITFNKIKRGKVTTQSYWAILPEWAITSVIYLSALIKLALRFPAPDNYLSIGFLILITIFGAMYLYKKYRKLAAQTAVHMFGQ